MAGVKGRSGGKREGAGRKPGPKPEVAVSPGTEPLDFLEGVMRGEILATPLQVRAAVAAAQYRHMKKGDGGVKDERADKAKAVAAKFKPTAAPLKLVGQR
jgi:hypothetical protein